MPASTIFGNFAQAQQRAQQEGRAQQNQAFKTEQQEFQRGQQFLQLDDQRKKALFTDAREVNTRLAAGDVNGAMGVIQQRLDFLTQNGGDTTDSMEIGNLIQSGNIQGARDLLSATEDVGMKITDNQGNPFLRDLDLERQRVTGKVTKTATQKDFSTFQDLLTKAKESGDPKDMKKAERFGRAARFIRETEQEKADIKVTQKEREAMVKANVTRKQGFIDSGIEAANGAANVSRALNLLDELKTGGFDNFALKAKRLFGVEGADEGELSNLMGKAVLSQLKPIFGAAFTVTESDKLDALEAGFGKSTANNKRLLENSLKIINRAARRGIAAAEDQGDEFTANEIREALSFKLEDKLAVEQPEIKQPSTIGRFTIEVQ